MAAHPHKILHQSTFLLPVIKAAHGHLFCNHLIAVWIDYFSYKTPCFLQLVELPLCFNSMPVGTGCFSKLKCTDPPIAAHAGGLNLLKLWKDARKKAGKDVSSPNFIVGSSYQVGDNV